MPADDRGGELSEQALREELLRRRDVDQAARTAFTGNAEDAARLIAIDDDNSAWLRTIVDAVGWPGHSLVGEEGAHAAWLIAQHADRRPALQRRCLELLQQAVARSEATPADLAYLTDRVLVASGEPQVYGTQLTARDGRFMPCRLRDPETLDVRRAAVGLETIEAYLARTLARYGAPSPARVQCPNCGVEVELWPPEPGGTTRLTCPACGAGATMRSRMRNCPARSANPRR